MDFTIRRARASDLAAVFSIQTHCAEAARWTEADYRGCISEHTATPLLVAESRGAIVGFLVHRPVQGGDNEILNLAIEAPQRRRGIARALIDQAFRDRQQPVYLEVRAGNSGAIAFYRRVGFVEVGRRLRYYSDPIEDALVMQRTPQSLANGE